jgi:hypothetical protein
VPMPIRRLFPFFAVLCMMALAMGQSGNPAPSRSLENGSLLYASLSKTVDAKKAKPGDPVVAELLADVVSHGKIVVRRESKLIGHVTEAQVRSKENPESRLGIVFDKIVLKGGEELPFRSVLLALEPAPRLKVDGTSAPSPPGLNSASTPQADRHYPTPKVNTPKLNTSINDELKTRDQQISAMVPTDIDGLKLSPPADGGAQAIVSVTRTVKLESGVRLDLRVTN